MTKFQTFGEIATFINGRAFKPEEWGIEGLPIIRIQNLTGSTNIINYYSGKFEQKHLIHNGDILISWSASLGVYIWEGGDAILNQHIFKVIPKNGVNKQYFYYAAIQALNQMKSNVHGTTMQHITKDPFESITIPLPPLPEQQRIAAILQKADRVRRLRRYALQLSEGYLQSVFLEMFGEYLNENCEHRFENVIAIPLANGLFEYNENYGKEGTPVIWVDNLYHTISVSQKNLRHACIDEKTIGKYEVISGDLLFTRSSLVKEGVGQINIVPDLELRTTFECHIIRARVNPEKVNPYYILELYRSPFGRTSIMKTAKTATMTTIGQEDVGSLPCPIPPLSLQNRFEKVVRKTEILIEKQSESLRQAEHLFQTLLHRAFAGQL